jgi:hypothetical protein
MQRAAHYPHSFVSPAIIRKSAWNAHYRGTVDRILERLKASEARGELSGPVDEAHAWAIMGMNVFLGLRYGVLGEERDVGAVADAVNAMLRDGMAKR